MISEVLELGTALYALEIVLFFILLILQAFSVLWLHLFLNFLISEWSSLCNVESPFEFRALEVALEAICSFLAARTTELESAAYPALDDLTSKVWTCVFPFPWNSPCLASLAVTHPTPLLPGLVVLLWFRLPFVVGLHVMCENLWEQCNIIGPFTSVSSFFITSTDKNELYG